MPGYPEELSIAGLDPESKVFTGQQDLKEVLVVQKPVLVGIVIVDQLLTVTLGELHHSIVSHKLKNTSSIQIFLSSSVDSHKS